MALSSISAPSASHEKSCKSTKYVLLLFTLYQSFLTTGIIYGWPSLLLVLRAEGVYSQLCSQTEGQDCDARKVAMNRVFTFGAVLNSAGSLLFGRVVDTLGPRSSMVAGLVVTILGSLSLAFAASESEVWWPLAYIAYGIGGSVVHLASFSIGNVFGDAKGMVVSILVAAFSLSSCTFQVMHLLYDHFGLSRQAIFIAHSTIEGVNLIGTLWLWPQTPLQAQDRLVSLNCRPHVIRSSFEAPELEPSAVSSTRSILSKNFAKALRIAASLRFIHFALYFSMQLWLNRCLMGWMDAELKWKDEQLQGRGDTSINTEQHLAIFNACQAFVGISAIPIFGFLVAKLGHKTAPFLATNLLAVFWLACLLVPAEWPLYVLYVFSGWHRQFFFSSFFVFLLSEFPMDVFATLSGFASLLAALLASTQNPILSVVLSSLHGDFTVPIVVQLGIVVFLSVIPAVRCLTSQLPSHKMAESSSQDTDTIDGTSKIDAGCEAEVAESVEAKL